MGISQWFLSHLTIDIPGAFGLPLQNSPETAIGEFAGDFLDKSDADFHHSSPNSARIFRYAHWSKQQSPLVQSVTSGKHRASSMHRFAVACRVA